MQILIDKENEEEFTVSWMIDRLFLIKIEKNVSQSNFILHLNQFMPLTYNVEDWEILF